MYIASTRLNFISLKLGYVYGTFTENTDVSQCDLNVIDLATSDLHDLSCDIASKGWIW